MKKYTIIIAFVMSCTFAYGQVLSTKVIASVSNYIVKQRYSLSWTLGETITETFVEGNNQLTQGFQQSYLYEISHLPGPSLNDKYNFKVYPGPSVKYFFVETNADKESLPLKLALYDMHGIKRDLRSIFRYIHVQSPAPQINP